MADQTDAQRIGRKTYHREYQRLRRAGHAPKAARRIAGRLGRAAEALEGERASLIGHVGTMPRAPHRV